MIKSVKIVIASMLVLASAGAASAQQTMTRWSDEEFMTAARCVVLAKETKAENAKLWDAAFKAQARGRQGFTVDMAKDDATEVKTYVKKNQTEKLEALKAACAAFNI